MNAAKLHSSTLALFLGLLLVPTALALASEVEIFRVDSREEILGGTVEGLAVGPLGTLELSHRLEQVASPEEPFVFTAAVHPDGWVLGTGNSGKVLQVSPEGDVKELFVAEEPEIFAVLAEDDGTVLAASSPHGKVYSLAPGAEEPKVVFESGDAYIWALARDARGRLLVGTGLSGRLYRVEADGSSTLLFESPDSHVRTIVTRGDRILVGTAGQGLIFEIEPDTGPEGDAAKVRMILDAGMPEVVAFAAGEPGKGGDGTVYAALLASEASLVDLSTRQAPTAPKSDGTGAPDEADKESEVTISASGQATAGSRGAGAKGARSLLVAIAADGSVTELERFAEETVYSLLWQDGSLWIGTGQEGKIYRRLGDRLVLESDLDERQVVALVGGGGGPGEGAAAVTTNASALYRIDAGRAGEGVYTSAVLDAEEVARFGVFRWRGELPAGAGLEIEVRSGLSSEPDATWTDWLAAGTGREVALGELSNGRFVQWRATFRAGSDGGPRLRSAELSYRQDNLPPEITSFEVLDPGQILVPQNFNPQNQTYEPWSPNREGIFTSVKSASENDNTRLKSLWKKGYRALRWEAEDPNGDTLEYALSFRREDDVQGDGADDEPWLPIVDELDEANFSFDATVLPDGVYRFRLDVADSPARLSGEGRTAKKVSEPAIVDHAPPRLVSARRDGDTIEAVLADAWSPLRDVVASVDAGEWRPASPADGLLDGRQETVRVPVPDGARMVLLRVTDAAWNVVTIDLLDAVP